MCDQLIMLAQLDHRRWLGCCEHGTVHLAWDTIVVRIPLQRLCATAQALQEAAQVARHFRIAGTGEVCVVFDQHDLYQVWFGGVGLCLSPDDFQLFCRLVGEAATHPTARRGHSETTLPAADSPIRTTYHLFSIN